MCSDGNLIIDSSNTAHLCSDGTLLTGFVCSEGNLIIGSFVE